MWWYSVATRVKWVLGLSIQGFVAKDFVLFMGNVRYETTRIFPTKPPKLMYQ